MAREMEKKSQYQGCWYRVSYALIIMVCGMLCRLQPVEDIHV